MPKGDRLKLKADPEDGTTPIANLLLEAVAMSKLSGLQVRAIIYLWRQTYGWINNDGQRLKESKITLTEWARALDCVKNRASTSLSELQDKNIIFRRQADPWGGYYYRLNTNIASWNSNSLNHSKLSECVTITHFGTVIQNGTVAEIDNSPKLENSIPNNNGTVIQNGTELLSKTESPTLYKEILNKDIKKEGSDVLEKHSPSNELKNTINKIIEKSPYGEGIRQVFAGLVKKRGYKTPKNQAEAKSIRNMLKEGYTPNQILDTWEKLKADDFWQGKELYMMSVEKQIGAILKANQVVKTGKYSHMVQS